jgi:glycosyltransferase involved in cell wall biosynthesis
MLYFLCASVEEDFGLIVAGCALVSTKYKGVYEYVGDKYNALLVPIKDSIKLAESIICSRMMIRELS